MAAAMAQASPIESLIESYVDSQRPAAEQTRSAKAIVQEVLHGRLTIQSLVMSLGPYLTTLDNIVRARGTLLLSDILVDLSGKPLEDTAIKSLIDFFSARLGDWHCLRGAVLGSFTLLRRSPEVGAVQVAEASAVAKSALVNLHVQALAQRDRKLCLELFECLLEKHADAVAPLEGDLIFGVVAAIEEEKDPRCLLLAFRLIQLLGRLYTDPDGPIAECADELFDVVSRYFPISFKPQPGAQDSITREDLATALQYHKFSAQVDVFQSKTKTGSRLLQMVHTPSAITGGVVCEQDAFACTPIFAPYCIPLLLEKLSSSLRTAKLDALNYLGHCGLSYGAKAIQKHTVPVWEGLKAELLPFSMVSLSASSEPQDVEVVKEALSCLSSWVLAFQTEKDTSVQPGDFLRLVLQDGLLEDLITYLRNDTGSEGPAMKDRAKHQSEAAGRILAEAARACPSSCFIICKQVLPRLLAASGLMAEEIVNNEEVISSPEMTASSPLPTCIGASVDQDHSRKLFGLGVVLQLVIAARYLAEKLSYEPDQSKQWLDPLREQSVNLLSACHQAITDEWSEVSSLLGVSGLQALASFPATLSPLSSNQLRRVLVILKGLLMDGTETPLLTDVLEKISSVEERSGTMEGDVGILTVVVPDLLRAVREAKTDTVVREPLQVLAKICGRRAVARQLVISHLTETINLDLSEAHKSEEPNEICAKLVALLQCLSEDILPWCDNQSTDQSATMGLAMEIWSIVSSQAIRCNQEVLRWSVKAMREAVVKRPTEVQSKILEKGVELLTSEEEVDMSLALVASVIVALRPNATVSYKETLLRTLVRAAQSEKPFLVTETAAQAVASMLNKWQPAGDEFNLETAINVVWGECCLPEFFCNTMLENPKVKNNSVRQKVSAVRAAAWVGKGLAMRGHNGVSVVASGLLRLLLSGASEEGKEEFGLAMGAAEGFSIIISDSEVGLNKAHHAVVRPLYKQRFFKSTLSPLVEAVRSSRDNPPKLWLYRGIGNLISGTPHDILLADGPNVFPLILGTLSFLNSDRRDSDLLLSTLLALSAFLVDEHQGRPVAGEHVSSIVKQMLTLIQYQHSVVVRETALRCLGAAVGLSYTRIYPLRTEVLKALSAAVGDNKRVVRKEAVRCRQAWTLITSK